MGDSGLYYVLCDEGCLTADRPGLGSGDGRWNQRVRGWGVAAGESELVTMTYRGLPWVTIGYYGLP